jgi:NADH-quinone oxidoreductase subunit C
VVYEPVELAQDLRQFDFMSPWEGAEYVLPGDEKAAASPRAGARPCAQGRYAEGHRKARRYRRGRQGQCRGGEAGRRRPRRRPKDEPGAPAKTDRKVEGDGA